MFQVAFMRQTEADFNASLDVIITVDGPCRGALTDVVTLGRSKAYICVLERRMHSHLFKIWLECVSNGLQGGLKN